MLLRTNNNHRIDYIFWGILSFIFLLLVAGGLILFRLSTRGMVLPQIIEVTPQRLVPFDHAVCPGEQTFKNVTYTINRPSVLEIDAVVYDVNKARPIPTTALSSSRPSPYAMSQTMGFTFTVPNLPKGDYEFQVGVSPKNQSSVTAFWVIPFSVAVGCPTPVPPPSPTEVGGNKGE